MAPKVWFVTGTSTGFGAELVKVILAKGDICVATARNPDKLSFSGEHHPPNFLNAPASPPLRETQHPQPH